MPQLKPPNPPLAAELKILQNFQKSHPNIKILPGGGPQLQARHDSSLGAGFAGGSGDQAAAMRAQGEGAKPATIRREQPKVGRNTPCPCGSGKKYKQCCGRK